MVEETKEVKAWDYEGYVPQENKDDKPLFKGTYLSRITGVTKVEGTSKAGNEYCFFKLAAQATDCLKGDAKGVNWNFDKVYFRDSMEKLFDDLFTAGLTFDKSSEDAFLLSTTALVDKTITLSVWSQAKREKNAEGEWVKKEPEELKQMVKVVKTKAGADASQAKLPF